MTPAHETTPLTHDDVQNVRPAPASPSAPLPEHVLEAMPASDADDRWSRLPCTD